MNIKGIKIYLLALVFAIIQMTTDVIKAMLQRDYFFAVFSAICLMFIIQLFVWVYHKHKISKTNGK